MVNFAGSSRGRPEPPRPTDLCEDSPRARPRRPGICRASGRFDDPDPRWRTFRLTRAALRLLCAPFLQLTWRGDRVAEGTRLLSGPRRNPSAGSNPALSAKTRQLAGFAFRTVFGLSASRRALSSCERIPPSPQTTPAPSGSTCFWVAPTRRCSPLRGCAPSVSPKDRARPSGCGRQGETRTHASRSAAATSARACAGCDMTSGSGRRSTR